MIAYYNTISNDWHVASCVNTSALDVVYEDKSDINPLTVPSIKSIQLALTIDLTRLLNNPHSASTLPTYVDGVRVSPQRSIFLAICEDFDVTPKNVISAGFAFVEAVNHSVVTLSYVDASVALLKRALEVDEYGEKVSLGTLLPKDKDGIISLYPYDLKHGNTFAYLTGSRTPTLFPLWLDYGWGEDASVISGGNHWKELDWQSAKGEAMVHDHRPLTYSCVNTLQLQPAVTFSSIMDWISKALPEQLTISLESERVKDYCLALPLFTEYISKEWNDTILAVQRKSFMTVAGAGGYQKMVLDVIDEPKHYYEYSVYYRKSASLVEDVYWSLGTKEVHYVFSRAEINDFDPYNLPERVYDFCPMGALEDTYVDFMVESEGFKALNPEFPQSTLGTRTLYQYAYLKDGTTKTPIDPMSLMTSTGTLVQVFPYWDNNLPFKGRYAYPRDRQDSGLGFVSKAPCLDKFGLRGYLSATTETPLEYLKIICKFLHQHVKVVYDKCLTDKDFHVTFKFVDEDVAEVEGCVTDLKVTPYDTAHCCYAFTDDTDQLTAKMIKDSSHVPCGGVCFDTGVNNNDDYSDILEIKAKPSTYLMRNNLHFAPEDLQGDITDIWQNPYPISGAHFTSTDTDTLYPLTCAFDKDYKQVDIHKSIFHMPTNQATVIQNLRWINSHALYNVLTCFNTRRKLQWSDSYTTEMVILNATTLYDGTNTRFVGQRNGTSFYNGLKDSESHTYNYNAPVLYDAIMDSGGALPLFPYQCAYTLGDYKDEVSLGDIVNLPMCDESFDPNKVNVVNQVPIRDTWKFCKFTLSRKLSLIDGNLPAYLNLKTPDGGVLKVMVSGYHIDPDGVLPTSGEGYIILT